MRIVHVTDCYAPRVGGIERQVQDLAERQTAEGHDVEVLTTTEASTGADPGGLVVHRPVPRRGAQDGMIRYAASHRLRAAALAVDADVLHLHVSAFSPMAYLTASSAAKRRTPTAVTVHSLWAYAFPLFRAADVLTGWGRWPFAWSAVSGAAGAPLRRIVGPSTPVSVVPNGTDVDFWRTPGRDVVPGRVVIATVGRLAVRKRIGPLLRILRRVHRHLGGAVELEVVVVGEGPRREALERYVARAGMTGWVRMPGAVEHGAMRDVYRDVDLYVAPATLESFGIAALEARCAGLPVVAHACSGVAEFISHGVEGLLVADDDAMVDAILSLVTSPSTLARMQAHNRAHPPAITWDRVLDQCGQLYGRAQQLSCQPATTGR